MSTALPPVVLLVCSCCGGEAPGRQWHNRDIGYGVCTRCADWIGERKTVEYMLRGYGVWGGSTMRLMKSSQIFELKVLVHVDDIYKKGDLSWNKFYSCRNKMPRRVPRLQMLLGL